MCWEMFLRRDKCVKNQTNLRICFYPNSWCSQCCQDFTKFQDLLHNSFMNTIISIADESYVFNFLFWRSDKICHFFPLNCVALAWCPMMDSLTFEFFQRDYRFVFLKVMNRNIHHSVGRCFLVCFFTKWHVFRND